MEIYLIGTNEKILYRRKSLSSQKLMNKPFAARITPEKLMKKIQHLNIRITRPRMYSWCTN